MRLIITGGGTGGHIYPALAIADYFTKKNPDIKVLYVGGKYGIENEILKNYDYDYISIDVLGFKRSISVENANRAIKSLKSLVKMRKSISKFKPDFVIGTGGYVTGPVVLAATTMKVKTAILEQNVYMGMTNKILSSRVDHVFYGFDEALKRYTRKNAIVSGNPVRYNEFINNKEIARKNLNYDMEQKIILSIGGSGGSDSLNKCIPDLAKCCEDTNIKLIHICGKGNKNSVEENIQIRFKDFELFEYIEGIGDYMRSSDLIICSSGASTLSEVAYLGKPAITIPKAYTAENHQEYNAMMIQNAGAGYCILERQLNSKILWQKVKNIIFDEDVNRKMSEESSKLHKGDACKIIYDTLVSNGLES